MNTKLLAVVLAVVALVLWTRGGGGAPIEDGTFLTYDQSGTTVRLTFTDDGGGRFRTKVELMADGAWETSEQTPGHGEVVSGKMRTESGAILELASFGPLWVAPGQLKEGGNAHGSRVGPLETRDGREVAVVSASLGMGAALRGEWLYDPATGFVVGGMMGTAMSGPDGGMRFRLVDSNVPGLSGS